jgi:hypothetical protein
MCPIARKGRHPGVLKGIMLTELPESLYHGVNHALDQVLVPGRGCHPGKHGGRRDKVCLDEKVGKRKALVSLIDVTRIPAISEILTLTKLD